jgi:hypothetical protein
MLETQFNMTTRLVASHTKARDKHGAPRCQNALG